METRTINRALMINQALMVGDGVTAWIWNQDLLWDVADDRSEKFARKMSADGQGSEFLRLRHVDSASTPMGLASLEFLLEHDKGRFFRSGGGAEEVASQSSSGSNATGHPIPSPFLTGTLPQQTIPQQDVSGIMLQQQQQQAGVSTGVGVVSTTQPNISGGLDQVGGQQMPRFGIDINVTGGAGRQSQYNQQQQQQQQLQNRGQNQFRGQRGFANRGVQHPTAGGFGGMGRGSR
jgi:hypothetical protein